MGIITRGLNVRGAFLHMLGDLLTPVVVLVNGLILIFKPWYWLDPMLSLIIVLFILKNCWSILKEAGVILMNATPKGLDIKESGLLWNAFPASAAFIILILPKFGDCLRKPWSFPRKMESSRY